MTVPTWERVFSDRRERCVMRRAERIELPGWRAVRPDQMFGPWRAIAGALFALWFASATSIHASGEKALTFPSPEDAARALVAALAADDTKRLLEILGSDAAPIIESGDPVADEYLRSRFVADYERQHRLDKSEESEVVLEIGEDGWPFAIPLVRSEQGWYFDTKQGKEEILDRRVGRAELSAIQSCLAYVDAQREYHQRNPENSPLPHYAQRIASSQGRRDGLYWDTTEGEEPSPLGDLFARARAEGYDRDGGREPYHGYFYRILTSQGPAAPGGAYDYIVRDQMIGGFAMLAYPAEYAASGVMTFQVNHDGVVYEKDLGLDTEKVAETISSFNPDDTWKPLDDAEKAGAQAERAE